MLTFLPSKRWNLIFPCTCRKTKRCITCTMTLSQPRLKLSWAIIMSVPLDWNPDQCFTNTWFNHAIHGQSFSNLTSFTHSQGIEDVLESYSFHKINCWIHTVRFTKVTPRNGAALQQHLFPNTKKLMKLHGTNIHSFSVTRKIHIGKFIHIGMQHATSCLQSLALF